MKARAAEEARHEPLRRPDDPGIRPTVAEIDLSALQKNLAEVRRLAPRALVLGVVKADAYGHGAVPVSRALAAAGVDWLGVALVEEGIQLRRAGIAAPIRSESEAVIAGVGIAGPEDRMRRADRKAQAAAVLRTAAAISRTEGG